MWGLLGGFVPCISEGAIITNDHKQGEGHDLQQQEFVLSRLWRPEVGRLSSLGRL